jgi:hypothetical protein
VVCETLSLHAWRSSSEARRRHCRRTPGARPSRRRAGRRFFRRAGSRGSTAPRLRQALPSRRPVAREQTAHIQRKAATAEHRDARLVRQRLKRGRHHLAQGMATPGGGQRVQAAGWRHAGRRLRHDGQRRCARSVVEQGHDRNVHLGRQEVQRQAQWPVVRPARLRGQTDGTSTMAAYLGRSG